MAYPYGKMILLHQAENEKLLKVKKPQNNVNFNDKPIGNFYHIFINSHLSACTINVVYYYQLLVINIIRSVKVIC